MAKFIFRLKNNKVLKTICYWGIIAFLFLYTFSIPAFSGRPKWYIISYFFMAALGGLTVFYTLLYTKFKLNKWFILPASFVGYALIGTIIYSHDFRHWLTLLLMLLTALIFYYAFAAIKNKRLIFIILAAAFSLFALYFAYIYRDPILHLRLTSARAGDYFDNVNAIGFYFAIAYSLALYLSLFRKSKWELFFLIPTIMFFVLGLFTGSRSFILSVAVASVVALYLKMRKHKVIFFIILVALVGTFLGLMNIPQLAFLKDQFDRTLYTLFGIGNSKVETSTVQRMVWPQYAIYLGGKNLIFGYGTDGFAIFSGVGTYAHNNYAEVICNFGLIGLILYYGCFVIPLLQTYKKEDEERFMVILMFSMFLVRSLFGVVYYTKEGYLIIALCFFLTKDYELYKPNLMKNIVIPSERYEVSI